MNRKKLVLILLDICLVLIVLLFGTHVVTLTPKTNPQTHITDYSSIPFRNISPFVLLTSLPAQLPPVQKQPKPSSLPENSEVLLTFINQERTAKNLDPLVYDSSLSEVATSYSEAMAKESFFSHTSPTGQTPSDRLRAAHISFQTAGENIAYAPSLDLAHKNLMASEEHKANILNQGFKNIGLGIFIVSPEKMFITELFTN